MHRRYGRRLYMWEVLLSLAALALALHGCDDDDDPARSPVPSQTSLTVTWAGTPNAGTKPLDVVLVAPADAQPAAGRVRDPTQSTEVFRHEADDLRGYSLNVFSGTRRLCAASVNVAPAESREVIVSLGDRKTCDIESAE